MFLSMDKFNLIKSYESVMKDCRDLPAITDLYAGKTLTYHQFAAKIRAYHDLFRKHGITKGDKIALVGRNGAEWVCVYFGAITYGAVIIPILADFNPTDMAGIIAHSDAKLLFADVAILEKLGEIKSDKLQETYGLETIPEPDYGSFDIDAMSFDDIDDESVAVISYTSGTTGISKGVMLPIRSLAFNVHFAISHEFFFKGSHTLGLLPLAHAYGAAFDMLSPLAAGSHIHILGRIPSPKVLLNAIKEVKPDLLCMVPLVIEKVVRKNIMPKFQTNPLKTLLKIPLVGSIIYRRAGRKLVKAFGGNLLEVNMGGAGLDREVEELLIKMKFPFTVGYGMTETGPLVSYVDWKHFKKGSCGKPLPGTEIRICKEHPEDDAGRIYIKGDNVTVGYYKNSEATQKTLQDGWLMTGDLGFVDKDGYIFLRGRCTSMILDSSGQNIYPEEIEGKLNHLDYVSESLVYQEEGKLHALVVPDFDRAKKEMIDISGILNIMKENLKKLNRLVAPYEKVSEIHVNEESFEKTPKQSIKRFLYPKKAKIIKQ